MIHEKKRIWYGLDLQKYGLSHAKGETGDSHSRKAQRKADDIVIISLYNDDTNEYADCEVFLCESSKKVL